MARISAVIPTLGASPLLGRALKALDRERRNGLDLEVILVGPLNVLAHPPGPVDRRLDTGAPAGFAEATNLGFEAARGEMLATLNDDAVVEPGWCRTLVETLERHPDAAAVQGVNLQLGKPHLADGFGIGWTRSWQAVQIGHGHPAVPSTDPPREVYAVSATAALYRRRALEEAGPFDPRLGSYYEDVDLGARLRSHGWTAWSVPAARAMHAGSVTGNARPLTRWRLLVGNRWLVVSRLLGRRFPGQAGRMLARDLADLGSAVLRADGPRAVGLLLGLTRAAGRLPAWMHRGDPLVPWPELTRFRISS